MPLVVNNSKRSNNTQVLQIHVKQQIKNGLIECIEQTTKVPNYLSCFNRVVAIRLNYLFMGDFLWTNSGNIEMCVFHRHNVSSRVQVMELHSAGSSHFHRIAKLCFRYIFFLTNFRYYCLASYSLL